MFDVFCSSGTWGSFGDFGVGGGIGLILTLIFWVGLLAGITLLVVRAIRRAQTSQTPFEILKARYAGGEITREEYEQLRRDLEG